MVTRPSEIILSASRREETEQSERYLFNRTDPSSTLATFGVDFPWGRRRRSFPFKVLWRGIGFESSLSSGFRGD